MQWLVLESIRRQLPRSSGEVEDVELDGPGDVADDEPAVVGEAGEGPGVGGAPLGRVDRVLVLRPHLHQAVLQPAGRLALLLHQVAVGLAGETGQAGEHHPAVAARRQQQLVVEGIVPGQQGAGGAAGTA